jgi:hypothetical protein
LSASRARCTAAPCRTALTPAAYLSNLGNRVSGYGATLEGGDLEHCSTVQYSNLQYIQIVTATRCFSLLSLLRLLRLLPTLEWRRLLRSQTVQCCLKTEGMSSAPNRGIVTLIYPCRIFSPRNPAFRCHYSVVGALYQDAPPCPGCHLPTDPKGPRTRSAWVL